MVRDERLGVGAARNRVQHRRFHFHEAVGEHVVADAGDDLAALDEAFAALLIHDEVKVALTVADFLVSQASEFFSQGANRLAHQANLRDAHGKFTALCFKDRAFGGHNVADIHLLEFFVGFFTHFGG